MSDALTHRGPDGDGVWVEGSGLVGFGHRRLSIVELSPLGQQPMVDRETGCVLTFNGEIYNFRALRSELEGLGHRFVGQSDTEVLLGTYRQWGVLCLRRLEGMFAFALWDPRERMLFAARDRAGEKPLYYKLDNNGFKFGSELKALMAEPSFNRRVDAQSLYYYLTLGYIPAPRSIFEGVSKLQPGCAITLRIDRRSLTTWRYWEVPSGVNSRQRCGFEKDADYVDGLEKLLEASVSRQLVADVPVGILLSGGIDSGLVTAMASRSSARRVSTFTIIFPGHGKYDESKHALSLSRHFNTDHHELEAKPASFELLPKLAAQFDEPMVDSSMIPMFLVSELIRRQAKVALGGDGGDELFGGYTLYYRLLQAAKINDFIRVPGRLKLAAIGALSKFYGQGTRGRNYLPALEAVINDRLPNPRNLFLSCDVWQLLSADARERIQDWSAPYTYMERLNVPSETMVYKMARADFSGYLAEDILTKVDRASMLNSLEVRAPLLDTKIIDFAFGIVPDRLKVRGKERKVLLKMLATRLFPEGYDFERKQGFSLPLSAWIRGGGKNALWEIIRECPVSVLNPKVLERMFGAPGISSAATERLFGVSLLSLWCSHYKVQF